MLEPYLRHVKTSFYLIVNDFQQNLMAFEQMRFK